jgi:hypothetical protein
MFISNFYMEDVKMGEWSIESIDSPEAQKAFREADNIELCDYNKDDPYEQIHGAHSIATMRPPGVGPHLIKDETILIDSTKPEQRERAIAAVKRALNS